MASRSFILFPGPATWRFGATDSPGAAITDIALSPKASAEDIALAVADALRSAGYRGEGVLLAIPSAWCLCASIAATGLPTRNRHQALVYRLEDKLPLAAEDVIADFLPFAPSDDATLGVCVQKTSLAPLVDALESNGVAIASICPAALLALQQMRAEKLPELAQAEAVVWPCDQGNALELFIVRDGRVCAWHVLPDDPKDLLLHLNLEFRTRQLAAGKTHLVAGFKLSPQISTAISAAGVQLVDLHAPAPPAGKTIVLAHLTLSPGTPGEGWDEGNLSSKAENALTLRSPGVPGEGIHPALVATITLAGSILAGKATPWINLRRDDLAVREPFRQVRLPLTCAAAAVILCLLSICGGLLWRANQYDRLAAQCADEQQAVYHQALPNTAAPGDVHSRLEAEERSLHGLSGDASAPRPEETGLVTLRDLLSHLPGGDELRYRVLELRLDPGRFTLEGQAAAHGDADSIVAALRRGGEFAVEPPRTEQLSGSGGAGDAVEKSDDSRRGVSFTITGAVVSLRQPQGPSRQDQSGALREAEPKFTSADGRTEFRLDTLHAGASSAPPRIHPALEESGAAQSLPRREGISRAADPLSIGHDTNALARRAAE